MKYLIFILPMLIVVNVKAQVIVEAENIYSLDTLLVGNLPDTIKLQLFKKEVSKLPYWASKKPFILAQKGLDYAESIGDLYYVGEMQSMLGLFHCNTSSYDTSIVLFKLALINFEKMLAVQKQAHCHGILRYLYAQTEEFEKSLEHCYKALKIYEDAGDEEGIGATYNDIAGTLINAKRYEEALLMAIKGRGILLKYDNVFELVMVSNKIADCYVHFENYKSAIIIYNEIIETVRKNPTAFKLMTKVECYSGRANVYLQSQEYDLATQDINRAKEILFSDPNPNLESSNILKHEEANIMLA